MCVCVWLAGSGSAFFLSFRVLGLSLAGVVLVGFFLFLVGMSSSFPPSLLSLLRPGSGRAVLLVFLGVPGGLPPGVARAVQCALRRGVPVCVVGCGGQFCFVQQASLF